jgi:hypothetical protein
VVSHLMSLTSERLLRPVLSRSHSAAAALCPAGQLPHEGGDLKRPDLRRRQVRVPHGKAEAIWEASAQLIFPLVGETPGRAEGGSSTHEGAHP